MLMCKTNAFKAVHFICYNTEGDGFLVKNKRGKWDPALKRWYLEQELYFLHAENAAGCCRLISCLMMSLNIVLKGITQI